MDPPEQALVQVGAAPLAAPSAAVAGLVPPRLQQTPSGPMPRPSSSALDCRASPRRPGRRRSRAPAVGQRHPSNHPQPRGRCRHRGPGVRSQSPGWRRAIAGRRRGLDCRDADGGPVAVTGDAGPLCTGPVGSTGRRRSRPLRSRIKPGSTTPPSSPPKGGDPRPLVRFSR